MASQIVTIFTIGGTLAAEIETDLTRWFQARQTDDPHEWAAEQWPQSIQADVNALVDRLLKFGFEPPILYRSQHVDLGSMGDAFDRALGGAELNILTNRFEVFAKRFANESSPSGENDLLISRIQEALAAWQMLESDTLILVVREVLGGLWMDREVETSLQTIPKWWAQCS